MRLRVPMPRESLPSTPGALTANLERFMAWRTVDGSQVAPKGTPELETVLKGVFEKSRFLSLLRDFTVFGDTGGGPVKIRNGPRILDTSISEISVPFQAA